MNKKLFLTITLLTGTAGLSASTSLQTLLTDKQTIQTGAVIGAAAAGSYALYKGAQWVKAKYQDYQEYREARKYAKGYHAVWYDGKFILWINGTQIVKITTDNRALTCYINGKNVGTITEDQMKYVTTAISAAINGPFKAGIQVALGMVQKAIKEATQNSQLTLSDSIFS